MATQIPPVVATRAGITKKTNPPPYDEQYSVTYDVEGLPDEVRQIMVDKGLWDIDEEFASFTVTELIITARDE